MIEVSDSFFHYLEFANRANPALTVVNNDGTFDIYLNTLYCKERLVEELKHELRHLEDNHFYAGISVARAERQADGEPLDVIGHAAPGHIIHFRSCKSLAHYNAHPP